jgi:cytochrome b6-f complex iron-sulfur subunit
MNESNVSRGQFIRQLGLSSAALMAYYCLGTTMMSSCSSSSDPAPSGGGNNSTGTLRLDLADDANRNLRTVGGFMISGNILIARTSNEMVVALSKNCTHQGTELVFRSAQGDLFCNNHGSAFNTNGTVKVGPAATALRVFPANLNNNVVTVTTA